MSTVYVQYNVSSTGGEIRPGQEDESYPNREPEHREHSLIGIFTKDIRQPGYDYRSDAIEITFDPKPDEPVYLVLVTYQTGDTFGYSTGNVCVVDVFDTEEEADKTARAIRKGAYKGYCAWEGYFERLEGIEVSKHFLDEQIGSRKY